MLENIKGAIENGQSREIGNRVHKTKKNNTIYDGHYYAQTNTNIVDKT